MECGTKVYYLDREKRAEGLFMAQLLIGEAQVISVGAKLIYVRDRDCASGSADGKCCFVDKDSVFLSLEEATSEMNKFNERNKEAYMGTKKISRS